MAGYQERFHNPRLMWAHEMERACSGIDWPTDGIPCVRPNLGVVFIPVTMGQTYEIREEQMPWPGAHLSYDAIQRGAQIDLIRSFTMRLAKEFYSAHEKSGDAATCPYLPDTQGVLDLAHILAGDELLHMVLLEPEWVDELMEVVLERYVEVTLAIKALIGEPEGEMVHAHGTPQGVYFPHAGVRLSEDSATLLSPQLIERFVLPAIERVGKRFGGVFVHYCGRHEALFDMLCRMACVRAIDLGNPEFYDSRWLMEICASTETALYSRLAAQDGEEWEAYTRRLGGLVRETGARCILRPLVFPESRQACAEMLHLWHELTA